MKWASMMVVRREPWTDLKTVERKDMSTADEWVIWMDEYSVVTLA